MGYVLQDPGHEVACLPCPPKPHPWSDMTPRSLAMGCPVLYFPIPGVTCPCVLQTPGS